MNLAQWKRTLKPGMKLLCTYRWYWEKTPQRKPASGQQGITVLEVKATQMIYTVDGKPERNYMRFPKASELKADDKGFELYMPDGRLMSRYEWNGLSHGEQKLHDELEGIYEKRTGKDHA